MQPPLRLCPSSSSPLQAERAPLLEDPCTQSLLLFFFELHMAKPQGSAQTRGQHSSSSSGRVKLLPQTSCPPSQATLLNTLGADLGDSTGICKDKDTHSEMLGCFWRVICFQDLHPPRTAHCSLSSVSPPSTLLQAEYQAFAGTSDVPPSRTIFQAGVISCAACIPFFTALPSHCGGPPSTLERRRTTSSNS